MSKPKKDPRRRAVSWVIFVFFLSFALSLLMSWSSSTALSTVGIAMATLTVLILVSIGIIFDILGVAVTSADKPPLVAMTTRRVPGARQALWMVQNADRMASICNDVVGDICGVVSGSAGATLAMRIGEKMGLSSTFVVGILVAAFIAALTVGGKAIGKRLAIKRSKDILMLTGRAAAFLSGLFKRK